MFQYVYVHPGICNIILAFLFYTNNVPCSGTCCWHAILYVHALPHYLLFLSVSDIVIVVRMLRLWLRYHRSLQWGAWTTHVKNLHKQNICNEPHASFTKSPPRSG